MHCAGAQIVNQAISLIYLVHADIGIALAILTVHEDLYSAGRVSVLNGDSSLQQRY